MNDKYWRQRRNEISNKITELWNHPELPMMEYESAEILCKWLEENEFQVERSLCKMPTAFRATYGSGKPVIGFLAEFDGMDGLANDAVPYYKPTGQRAGHACLHCHIGGSNTGAAIAAKEYLKDSRKTGTIVVVGCPAEEMLYGKVALLGEGGFDGIDILLTCHVDYQNCAVSRPTLSCFSGEFCFGGISSHSGAARAHNALDGAELSVQSIERMRAHQFPKTSVEHVIRNGGKMPNITPSRASLWVNIRDENYETAKKVYDYIRQIVKESAKIAGVSVTEGFLAGSRGYLPNDTLGDILYAQLEKIGVTTFTEEDMNFMRELTSNVSGLREVVSMPELCYLKEGVDPYSQDDGEVSWHIPLGRVNWEIPLQIPLHNWCTTALAGTEFSKKGALMASEAIYGAAVEIIDNPQIVEIAEKERLSRIDGKEVEAPLYDSLKELIENPTSFWDGTWLDGRL